MKVKIMRNLKKKITWGAITKICFCHYVTLFLYFRTSFELKDTILVAKGILSTFVINYPGASPLTFFF